MAFLGRPIYMKVAGRLQADKLLLFQSRTEKRHLMTDYSSRLMGKALLKGVYLKPSCRCSDAQTGMLANSAPSERSNPLQALRPGATEHGDGPSVLRPAAVIITNSNGALFTIRNRANAIWTNTLRHQIGAYSFRPATAQA